MASPSQPKLRMVIIGAGAGVLNMHRPGIELETTQVVGVTDVNAEAAQKVADTYGCPSFPDYKTMLAETKPDVAVILTPHPFHAPIAIDCLKAGCHVLVEKPMTIQVSDADAMVAAAAQSGKLLAVNYQQRTRPEIIAARKLIQEGRLGKIQHVDVKMTWTRAGAYFKMSNWRGTWNGEGGGVLMNQGTHELDLVCYLVGMPARVYGWARTILHEIEVEDTIQAMVEWSNGAIGSLHITTAEAGQPQRFEILGTGGRLAIGHNSLDFQRFEPPLDEFVRTSDQPFGAPKLISETVELPPNGGDHRAIHQNLYDAIVHGKPLVADGASGVMGLELGNAINYSSYTGQTVEFPLDREAYAALLTDLKAGRLKRGRD
jgi:predicted dehydrogenase